MKKIILILLFALAINATEIHYVNPSRALTTPVSDILKSLDVFLSGGGTVGIEGEAYFLGNINMGFGDLFELEFSLSSIINALQEKSSLLPTSVFKMKVIDLDNPDIGLSFLIKKTIWNVERYFYGSETYYYYTRYADFIVIGGFKNNYVNVNIGGKFTDLRAMIKDHNETILEEEKMKKIYGGFLNILLHVNPKTYGIFEITDKIKINYIGETSLSLDRNVTSVIAASLGGRYFFNEFISIDAGIIWRSDYKGIGDAVINAGINIGIPLSRYIK